MDIETCIKYLNYVSQECERHLRDKQVTDDELSNLIIQFQRFQDKTAKSNLPDEIKTKISDIKLNYSLKNVERGTWFLIAAFLTLGSWGVVISMNKQKKRKEALTGLKFDTSRLASNIRLNYQKNETSNR